MTQTRFPDLSDDIIHATSKPRPVYHFPHPESPPVLDLPPEVSYVGMGCVVVPAWALDDVMISHSGWSWVTSNRDNDAVGCGRRVVGG